MNLDFLTPAAAADAIARSPMERSAAAEGAKFEVRDGWNVAVGYGASGAGEAKVTWADVSHLGKLELQAPASQLADAVASVTDGARLELGTATRVSGLWWCPLSSTRVLAVGPGTEIATARERLTGIHVADVTTTFAAMTLAGPLAREVFARFCALDLRPHVTPPGALRPGSIARQPGILICEAPDRYLFLFGWATGEYMWSVVADAGFHLGGRPVGVDALEREAVGA